MYYLVLPIMNIPAPPSFKITELRPRGRGGGVDIRKLKPGLCASALVRARADNIIGLKINTKVLDEKGCL